MNKFILPMAFVLLSSLASATVFVDHSSAIKVNVNELVDSGLKAYVLTEEGRSRWDFTDPQDSRLQQVPVIINDGSQFDVMLEFYDGFGQPITVDEVSIGVYITGNLTNNVWRNRSYESNPCRFTGVHSVLLSSCEGRKFADTGEAVIKLDVVALQKDETGAVQSMDYSPRYVKIIDRKVDVRYSKDGLTYAPLPDFLDIRLMKDAYFLFDVLNVGDESIRVFFDEAGIGATPGAQFAVPSPSKHIYAASVMPTEYSHSTKPEDNASVDIYFTFKDQYAFESTGEDGRFHLSFALDDRAKGSSAPYLRREMNYTVRFDVDDVQEKCLDVAFKQLGHPTNLSIIGDDGDYFDLLYTTVSKSMISSNLERCPVDIDFDLEFVPESGLRSSIVDKLKNRTYAIIYPSKNPKGGTELPEVELVTSLRKPRSVTDTYGWIQTNSSKTALPCADLALGRGVGALSGNVSVLYDPLLNTLEDNVTGRGTPECSLGVLTGSGRNAMVFSTVFFNAPDDTILIPDEFKVKLRLIPYVYTEAGVKVKVSNPAAVIEKDVTVRVEKQCLQAMNLSRFEGEVTLNEHGENGFLKIDEIYGSYKNVCPFPIEISRLYMVNGDGLAKSDLRNIEADFDRCDEASTNPFEPINFNNCTRIFSKLDLYSPEDMVVPFSWSLEPDEIIHIPSRLMEDAYTQSIPPYFPSIAQPYKASILRRFVVFAECVYNNSLAGAKDVTEIDDNCASIIKSWPALSSEFFRSVNGFDPYFVIEYRAVDWSKERAQWPWMTFSHHFDNILTCDRCGLEISRPQVLAMNAWGQPIWLFYIQKSLLTKIHSAACEGAAQDYHGGYCDVDQATFALLRRLEIKKRLVDAYLRGVQRAFSKVYEDWGSDSPQSVVNLLDQVNISNTEGCQYHLLPGGGFNLTSTNILKCAIFDLRNHTKEDETLLAPYVISEMHDTLVDMIADFNATQGGYDNDGAGGAGIFLARELHECIQVSSRDKFMLVRAFPDGLTAESPTVLLSHGKGGRNNNFFGFGIFTLASKPDEHYFDITPSLDYTVRSITLGMNVPSGEEYDVTMIIQDRETGEELMNTTSTVTGFNLNLVVPGDITLASGRTYRMFFQDVVCKSGDCADAHIDSMVLQVAYARLETGDPILNAFDHLLQCVSETDEEGNTMSNYKFSVLNDVISSTSMSASVGLGLQPLIDSDPVFARSFERLYGFIKGLAAGKINEGLCPGETGTGGKLCLESFSCGTSNVSIDLVFDDSYDRHMDCTVGGVYREGGCGGAYNAWYNYSGYSSSSTAANYLKVSIEAKPFYSPEEHDDEPPWDSACDVPDPHYKPEGIFDDIDTDHVYKDGQVYKDGSNCTDNGNNFSCVFEDYDFPLVKEPDYIPFYMPAAGGLTTNIKSINKDNYEFVTSDVAFASKAVHFYAQDYDENLSNEPNRTIMNFFANMLYPGYVDNASFAYERAALLRNSPFDDRAEIESIMAGLEWGLQEVGNGLFYTSNYNRNNVVKAFICENLTISPLRLTTEALGGNYLYYNSEDCDKLFNSPYKLGAALGASDINVTEWMGFYNSNNTTAAIVTVVKPIVYFKDSLHILNYVPQTYVIAKDNTTMSTLLRELASFWRGELPSNILFLYKNMSTFWLLKGARLICDVEASMKYMYLREASDTMEVSIQDCLDYYHDCVELDFPDEDLCDIPKGQTPCSCRVEGDFTEKVAMDLLVQAIANSISASTTTWDVPGMPGNWEQYFNLLRETQSCDMQGFLYGIFSTRVAKYYDFMYKKFGEPAPFIEILPGGIVPATDPIFERSSKLCNAIKSISADERAPCSPEGYDANCSITLRIRPKTELAKVYGPGGFDLEEMVSEEIIPGQKSEFFGYISNDYSNNYGRPIKLLFNTTFYVTGDIGWLIPLLAD